MSSFGKFNPRNSLPILFGNHWPASDLDKSIEAVDLDALCAEYTLLRENAPRRSRAGRKYFMKRGGITASRGTSNRREEHCALALLNLRQNWPRSDGGWFQFLDYQVPLKARQSDVGIGKIDLLGLTDKGRLMIVELKVESQSGGRSDAPPAALMEGLRYAAMVEADLDALAKEATQRLDIKIAPVKPIVQLLAPEAWWDRWTDLPAAGNWRAALSGLSRELESVLDLTIEFAAFDNVEVIYGTDGQAPQLDRVPTIFPIRLL